MGKFALICAGPKAKKRVTVPLRAEPEPSEIVCFVRPLKGVEDAQVIASAIEFAKSRGVDEPKPGDQLYEFGIWVHTIVLGCLDEEAPHGPYFDSAEQVLEHLDRDRIALLFEHQQTWQDECAPRQRAMSSDAFKQLVLEIALQGDDAEIPFAKLQPVLLKSFVRTMARLLATSNELKSSSGSDSEKNTPTATN